MGVSAKKRSDTQNPGDFVQAQLEVPADLNASATETVDKETGSSQFSESCRPKLIQIEKYNCKTCDFKGNLGEVQRHEQEKHQAPAVEKKKRPIPNLIPIQSQKALSQQSELTKENVDRLCGTGTFKDFSNLVNDDSPFKELGLSTPLEFPDHEKKIDSFRKKNASFFDKLKEKLMTSANIEGMLTCTFCGHEAKCLSEHMKHQKSHIPGERDDQSESSVGSQGVQSTESSSTRCQHCRHRCKSSSDLMLHLQTCKEVLGTKTPADKNDKEDASESSSHPMENKVFVWNNLTENNRRFTSDELLTVNSKPASPPKPIEEKAFVGIEVKPGYGTTTNDGQEEPITSKDVNTKKVFKCPHCSFWASTASRFHVHIVGHLNKRPFQCSLCLYSSNWRWDITKHIRLKTVRDPSHEKAKVLLTDETGRRNYAKYKKYLTTMKMESQQPTKLLPRRLVPREGQPQGAPQPGSGSKRPLETKEDPGSPPKKKPLVDNKKTMWKCKKCYFKDSDREVVLDHVRDHYRNANDASKKKKKPSTKPVHKDSEVKSEPEDDEEFEENHAVEFMCETCPFSSKTWNELEAHSEKHFVCTINGKQFKCQFCSFYAQDSEELTEHLELHKELDSGDNLVKKSSLACLLCPYVAITKIQLIYHRRQHDKVNSLHQCYRCSYSAPNNTILALHVRLHGRHNGNDLPDAKNGGSKLQVDISQTDTTSMADIPMVWVSKPMGMSKMFKCRFCPHINMRKSNIQEHEKMHRVSSSSEASSSPSGPQHKCPDCNYISNNAGVLAAHFKVHQALFGQIVGIVDATKSDDEQISEMKDRLSQFESSQHFRTPSEAGNVENDGSSVKSEKDGEDRVLRFCSVCPARFFYAKEMKIHMRFHELKLLFKCDSCSYTARQKQHLEAHYKVHTDEYQKRTKVLTEVYDTDVDSPMPTTSPVKNKITKETVWVVVNEEGEAVSAEETKEQFVEVDSKTQNFSAKQYSCSKCPAEFFKSVALSYHETLHGGPGPHRCKFCDYAVKTYGNLIRHEAVHKGQHPKKSKREPVKVKSDISKSPAKSPPSTPLAMDPEFGILIHGSPEFTYPTYLKNGKTKEKRYKCHKCPSAFEKREQYKIHLSLHGSKQRYSCDRCDYSVKYFANYTQHIKKHDTCDASYKGKRLFEDDYAMDSESSDAKVVERSSKSMKMSTADQQALMLLQQRHVASAISLDKDAVSRCPHCPYTNNRKEGVSSHVKCHSNTKGGPYVCKFCDYTVPQVHFLRDHMKLHFNVQKFVKPDAYMKVEHMEIWAEPLQPSEDTDQKFLVFKDQGDKVREDRFLPKSRVMDFDNVRGRIYINLKTGEEEVEMDEEEEEEEEEEMGGAGEEEEDPAAAVQGENAEMDEFCSVGSDQQAKSVDRSFNSKNSSSSDSECSDLSISTGFTKPPAHDSDINATESVKD